MPKKDKKEKSLLSEFDEDVKIVKKPRRTEEGSCLLALLPFALLCGPCCPCATCCLCLSAAAGAPAGA